MRSAAKALDVPIDRLKTVALTQCAISPSEVSVLNAKLEKAVAQQEAHRAEKTAALSDLADAVERNGLRATARALGIDPSYLRRRLAKLASERSR